MMKSRNESCYETSMVIYMLFQMIYVKGIYRFKSACILLWILKLFNVNKFIQVVCKSKNISLSKLQYLKLKNPSTTMPEVFER